MSFPEDGIAFDVEPQVALFHVLIQVGGHFGVIMRHQVSDLATAECDSEYSWLDWTHNEFREKMIEMSKALIIRAVCRHDDVTRKEEYFIECDKDVKRRIKHAAKTYFHKHRDELLYPPSIVEDNITTWTWAERKAKNENKSK